MSINQWLFTSKTDLRATPQDFFDKLNEEFNFTLDPCATPDNHKCERYYTKEQDGLKQSRDNEVVFCNPPYWKEIKNRVKKWYFARGGGDRYAATCENWYEPISRLHIPKSRNTLYTWTLKIWLKQKLGSVSEYGSNI